MSVSSQTASSEAGGNRCLYLMLSLLALLLVYPYVLGTSLRLALLTLLNSLTLLAGIYAVSGRRAQVAVAVVIAAPQLGLAWWNVTRPERELELPAMALLCLFYGFTLYYVLRYLFRPGDVTREKIFAAVSVYLLLGLMWGALYMFVETLRPGAFSTSLGRPVAYPDLMYYSFVTLTTLGYGEITPAIPQVQSLAVLEATSGVLYLAVLVARLVASYRSEPAG